MKSPVKRLARAAVISALYFVLSFFVPAISYGPVQFRISEALCVLPALFPEAVLGLTAGCLLTNVFSPFGVLDAVLGTSATFIAAVLTYLLRRKLALSALSPIILNALIVPLIWVINKTDTLYYINMLTILASQSAVIIALGIPLAYGLKKAMPREVLSEKQPPDKSDGETT